MIGPLLTLIQGEPGMAERILSAHVDDGTGRCTRCVAHDRPASTHPCLLRLHAVWALDMRADAGSG